MYVVLLKFSANREAAGRLMQGHRDWLRRGFDDGAFLLAGTLQPGIGGGILARGEDRAAIEARVAEDPFVAEDVVRAEILELAPALADERLAFLVDQAA